MGDINAQKLQLRPSLPTNGDKTPSPATKLLINHGKPNFTIPRSSKTQNGSIISTPHSPAGTCHMQSNNNKFVVKSTTFNGVFKPSNISLEARQTLPQNGNTITNNATENEATKVVLRRANVVQTEMRDRKGDENVPEFILRQRRIQERLANQNILDFENRRSGYFTQVLISPSSPNRQSFVETMSSPAVKPGLEIPPPPTQYENIKEEPTLKEQEHEHQLQPEVDKVVPADYATINGQDEEEEVARAIEEVNKAVEGEDDDKTEYEEQTKSYQHEGEQNMESTLESNIEETRPEKEMEEKETADLAEPYVEAIPPATAHITSSEEVKKDQAPQQNGHIEENVERFESNGATKKEPIENDTSNEESLENSITISHTNGLNGPSIPAPDPKGEKGVNFESKTVVSFSQELGNVDNKYPDTVKVVKDVSDSKVESELKELTKLKFEIKGDEQNIEVKPVLITETA